MEKDNAALEAPENAVDAENTYINSKKEREDGDQNQSEKDNLMLQNQDSPIPIKILKRPMPILSEDVVSKESSPAIGHPSTSTTPSPQGKNYKILYNEVTKRLFEQAEAGNRRYLELEAAHEDLKSRFSAMRKMYDDQAAEHNRKMVEKDATIDELKARSSEKLILNLL